MSSAWKPDSSLTSRILALNIFALAMLAGGFFYLDSYRTRLVDQRVDRAGTEAHLAAEAVERTPPDRRATMILAIAEVTNQRIRLYDAAGKKQIDSWQLSKPNYQLVDPHQEPWRRHVARMMDRIIDAVVGAASLPPFEEPANDRRQSWFEAEHAVKANRVTVMVRNAADRTPMVSVAAPIEGPDPGVLFTTVNARDITKVVRAERYRLGVVLALVVGASIALSLFLGRTIVQPLRRLARAAHLVRQGRMREVVVPRLPRRRDEIGLLARAVSDMSLALRQRIDATEAFAADVTHELKNPLASLSSAVDSLALVKTEEQRQQLLTVVRDDVIRLDRLITDIAAISRLDAELSRTHFERVDLGTLMGSIVGSYSEREQAKGNHGPRIAFARPRIDTAVVMGDESRLARAFENVIENAISFSPPSGLVEVAVALVGTEVRIRIDDEGPGVPDNMREAIFDRFHSFRSDDEPFGKHSGLGLAIARAIFDAHDGTIAARDRGDGKAGASFLIRIPAAIRVPA